MEYVKCNTAISQSDAKKLIKDGIIVVIHCFSVEYREYLPRGAVLPEAIAEGNAAV